MVEDAEEEHDIEMSKPLRRRVPPYRARDIRRASRAVRGLEKGVEFDAIHGHDVGAAPFAFEAEPAVPGADIEHALAAQIFRETEKAQAPAEVFHGLQAGEHAAIGEFDRVVPEAFGDALGELLHAAVIAAVGRGDTQGFRHPYIVRH